ncbi:sensor histidine kinase [Zhihengliuella sp.]|uniref:sensor histidine kinase n=1 Tax=Zhihengliuella sp. TaxID=1954483 RepID=UPI00281229F2|nr:sensor histidine kinase [Zhihengliuella sp.]
MSLAGQLLALQLVIVVVMLAGVLAISMAQSAKSFERTEGRRALSAAETLAAMPLVRAQLPGSAPRMGAALPSVTESVRAISGASLALLASPEQEVVASTSPALLGTRLDRPRSAPAGRSWTGRAPLAGQDTAAAFVPVLNDAGQVVGTAVVARDRPHVLQLAAAAVPNLAVYMGLSLALGISGSLLLARRVKRQTFGLEPREIAALAEHRSAVLHGIKEGVVAVDSEQRITVLNGPAAQLLDLSPDAVSQPIGSLGLPDEVVDALTSDESVTDELVLAGSRLIVVNRRPIVSGNRVEGRVTTLRDRTELETLERELGTTRATTEMLRAQTHEFANQLHTISGLVQLREYDEVIHYIDGLEQDRTAFRDGVTERVGDPTVAAVLIAKSSLAAERGVRLSVSDGSSLGRIGDELSRDVAAVVGNLADNAIDACARTPDPRVHVELMDLPNLLRCVVADSGPGISDTDLPSIFRRGFSTKTGPRSERGYGLAIVRALCRRHGGDVRVENRGGAVFTAEFRREGR